MVRVFSRTVASFCNLRPRLRFFCVSLQSSTTPTGGEHRRTLKYRRFPNSAGSEKVVLSMRERTVAKYLVCRVHLCRTPTGLTHPSGARVRLFITWVAGVVGFVDRVPQDALLRQILQKALETSAFLARFSLNKFFQSIRTLDSYTRDQMQFVRIGKSQWSRLFMEAPC